MLTWITSGAVTCNAAKPRTKNLHVVFHDIVMAGDWLFQVKKLQHSMLVGKVHHFLGH